jgi:hypothetical protein
VAQGDDGWRTLLFVRNVGQLEREIASPSVASEGRLIGPI